MRQVPLECDINIAVNGCSGFVTSTQKGPFTAILMSRSRGTYLIDGIDALQGEEGEWERGPAAEGLRDEPGAADAQRHQRPQHRNHLAPHAKGAPGHKLIPGDKVVCKTMSLFTQVKLLLPPLDDHLTTPLHVIFISLAEPDHRAPQQHRGGEEGRRRGSRESQAHISRYELE